MLDVPGEKDITADICCDRDGKNPQTTSVRTNRGKERVRLQAGHGQSLGMGR
jgi:hypothetical protein